MKLPLFAPDTRNDHPFFKNVPVMSELEEQVTRKGICTKCHTKTLTLLTTQAGSEFHSCRTCKTTFVLSNINSPLPKSSDEHIELAIKAAGADKAPRVTPADIEANIAEEHYFTAREGCEGACGGGGTYPVSLGLLTFCVLTLRNGFTVTGESACTSPENFNAEIGRKIARENAVAKMWPLMGYKLKCDLQNTPPEK